MPTIPSIRSVFMNTNCCNAFEILISADDVTEEKNYGGLLAETPLRQLDPICYDPGVKLHL
jgi:hypothetical protein